MSPVDELPQAARPFVTFSTYVRAHGFASSPDQTTSFLAAVELLGPRNMEDIRRAAHATLAPTPERRAEFDALFRAFFQGQSVVPPTLSESDDDTMRVQQDEGGLFEPELADEEHEAGQAATGAEMPSQRRFSDVSDNDLLRRFRRLVSKRLPVRRGHRRFKSNRGDTYSLRRALRGAVRRDGEILVLPQTRRKLRQRKILLLIDVSGSMKAETESYLCFAHTLFQASERIEVFTLGTRLTRVSRALRVANREQALDMAAGIVSDWDGGTRIGDALQAFLSLPRYAGFARGAVTLILSDGLERGDPAAMSDAVARLARLSWRLSWLTPLAGSDDFRPQTAALQSIVPYVNEIRAGASVEQLCKHVLGLAQSRSA